MFKLERYAKNPILSPSAEHAWESEAAFNPSVVKDGNIFHVVYRAVSKDQDIHGHRLQVSSIGYATSKDGVSFENRRQIIFPEFEWEKFGCEDPRITKFEDSYFIFYTALGDFPFSASSIKVAVAITKDFKTFKKHLVTPFNSKAMALFPERIGGKVAALLTAHTDMPPSKICLALFDKIEDLWSPEYWARWYEHLDEHEIPLPRGSRDHIELGTPPVKTKHGWLFFYSYIYNYFSPPPTFGVQAALLDLKNPFVIKGEVMRPFFTPEEGYELYGKVPNIVFPSGTLVNKKSVYLYYGAADTSSCLLLIPTDSFLEKLIFVKKRQLERSKNNPIIVPNLEHPWEAQATFNPAALQTKEGVHILYRAMSNDNTSVVGYAFTKNGERIDERLNDPVYVPREEFEIKKIPGGNSGCEDARLTRIGDMVYMFYTAYSGAGSPRVALTSVTLKDFLARNWNWAKPILISPPGEDDKDAAIFPEKIKGKYAILHRLGVSIWIDFVSDLSFRDGKFLGGKVLMGPRDTAWDSRKIGICGPPIKTKYGWLLLYHGISRRSGHYNVRAALLDLKNPMKILYRTHDPILEPQMKYEKEGIVPNVVFPCGSAIIKNKLYVYYGGADKVVGVASAPLKDLLETLFHDAMYHSR